MGRTSPMGLGEMNLSDESKVNGQNRSASTEVSGWGGGVAGWACDPPMECSVVLGLLMDIHNLQSDAWGHRSMPVS